MRKRFAEYSTFFREFRATFDTTGALAPSGRFLARALARPLRERTGGPVRILEVGPGTGAVTQEIVRHVRKDDCFHIVELNDRFVALLKRRFDAEPRFRQVAEQTSIFHAPVQDLQVDEPYDFLICGLPFNNFPPELVETIFSRFVEIMKPGGSMTFFEYLWVRPFKKLVANRDRRRRVVEVGGVLRRYLDRYEHARDNVYLNVLPAVAHYLRVEGNGNGKARPSHDAAAL
jgi:phospholipid N-methyltransferase